MNKFQVSYLIDHDHVFIDLVRAWRSIEYRLEDSPRFVTKEVIEELCLIDGWEEWEEGIVLGVAYFIWWELFSPKFNQLIESHKKYKKKPNGHNPM